MPSSLRKFNRKPAFIPKEMWDGPGYYYHRGEGRWIKWSRKRDRARSGKVGTGKRRHTHDIEYTRAYLRRKGVR